jgi:cell wall-associated NlpC family hydrolase
VKRALIVATVGGVCLLVLLVLLPLLMFAQQPVTAACGVAAAPANLVAPAAGGGKAVGSYTAAQVSVARQIVAAGKSLGVSPRGQTIGIMTGIGESGLAPIDVGDVAGPDSRGVFQQRSSGWGTYAQRMDPFQSAISFFKVLLTTPYDTMTPTAAAHKVQVNQDPNYYTKFWPDAVMLYSQITGDPNMAAALAVPVAVAAPTPVVPCTAPADTNAQVQAAIAFARAQLGKPYQFGGTGPLYDCSGLTQAAYAAAGVPIPRSSQEQATIGTPVAQADLQPGDLVFEGADLGHVQMVTSVANGQVTVIESPQTGGVVQEVPMRGFYSARRVVQPSATASGGFALPLPRAVLTEALLAKPHHDSPGADLPTPTGTPIYAVEGGTVTFAGPMQGFGDNFVAVKDAAGWSWYYGHGSAHNVTVGQVVKAGDQIASVGTEGFSTGPHLHLGLNSPTQNVPTTAPSYCPQAVLTAMWNAQPTPDLGGLSTTACIGGHL